MIATFVVYPLRAGSARITISNSIMNSYFFFSSRRRHTRLQGDWSSDVCSSDLLNLKGVYTMKENERFYPKRDMAAHVLGYVDLDEKGQGGIEHQLDKQIGGKGEKILVMADAKQRWFDGGQAHRDEGANVVLTIDEKIQYVAERELQAGIARTHAIAGTVIIQNPNTGEILALANWPKFNPNSPGEVKPEARMDRAVSAIYEPGSTFKLITLAAALDPNLKRPAEVFDCEMVPSCSLATGFTTTRDSACSPCPTS